MSYFPMFIELAHTSCLLIGGGEVAYRKALVLLDFGADIIVVAPKIVEEIKQNKQICCIERAFMETDLENKKLVIVATNDRVLNHQIAELCHKRKLFVNVVDQMEDCDFIFGSYVKEGDVVAAISSGGNSPVITQYLKSYLQTVLTKQLGKMAEYLGMLRPRVKTEIEEEAKRKKVYEKLLDIGLKTNKIPDEQETEAVLEQYRNTKEGK